MFKLRILRYLFNNLKNPLSYSRPRPENIALPSRIRMHGPISALQPLARRSGPPAMTFFAWFEVFVFLAQPLLPLANALGPDPVHVALCHLLEYVAYCLDEFKPTEYYEKCRLPRIRRLLHDLLLEKCKKVFNWVQLWRIWAVEEHVDAVALANL